MRTYTPKPDEVTRTWHLIDAEGKVLGRLAVEIANLLRGKHKPTFSYNTDVGDHVVVVNADKLVLTSNKAAAKRYYRHSGYPGGLRSSTFEDEMSRHPDEVLRRAVRGMLPKNRLSRQVIKKLKVYAGPEHPHEAQFKGTPGAPNSNAKRREAKERRKSGSAKKRPANKPAQAAPAVEAEPEAETVEEAPVVDAVTEGVSVEVAVADDESTTEATPGQPSPVEAAGTQMTADAGENGEAEPESDGEEDA